MHTHTHSYIEALTNNCLSGMLNDQKCSDTPALEVRCDTLARENEKIRTLILSIKYSKTITFKVLNICFPLKLNNIETKVIVIKSLLSYSD